jgi:hypothetical protein
MVWTKSPEHATVDRGLAARGRDGLVGAIAGVAAAVTIVAWWLPIFQVGGYVYTMIDSFAGGPQFVAAVVLPIVLAAASAVRGRRWTDCASPAVLATAVVVTLSAVDHLTEAWRRGDPARFGSLFQLRAGFFIGVVAVAGGIVVFVALVERLLREPRVAPTQRTLGDVGAMVAGLGLLLAIAGHVSRSSEAHIWSEPLLPQVGRWWRVVVISTLCGIAISRRSRLAIVAAAPAAIVTAAVAAQELVAVAPLEDDPAVSTTVTLVGSALLAGALGSALARSASRR